MEKDVDPNVVKATQMLLGKYVKRPPLSDKLLRKPPFRFLHDIITTVLKTTGFFEGLFEEGELISDNVKDRESKIVFLNKVIAVTGLTTGKTLSVKSSKIVSGQEPEKTNELLQCLAQALDKNLSSEEAVKKYKETVKSQTSESKTKTEAKTRESTKIVKKSNDVTSLKSSKSSEKLISHKNEKVTKADKDKHNNVKPKQKETIKSKRESPPKKTSQQLKTISKANTIENPPTSSENKIAHDLNIGSMDIKQVEKIPNNESIDVQNQITSNTKLKENNISSEIHQEDKKPVTSSINIETDLDASLSSQDLMEVETETADKNQSSHKDKNYNIENKSLHSKITSDKNIDENKHSSKSFESNSPRNTNNSAGINNKRGENSQKEVTINSFYENDKTPPLRNNTNIVRPLSVRPSSSRPGAPRLRDKHDNVTEPDNILVGKVNIIAENTPNEEEEDASIIIEHQTESAQDDHIDDLQMLSDQHGHLVQQILNSQKEFSQNAGKTEIEWQFGGQRAREAINQEIEQIRFNIQALSRVANPLGKLLDHIQEDVEVMRQELLQWTKTHEEASKELSKQKTINEESLFPLHTKLKQLDKDIKERHEKINDLQIVLNKNSTRIDKLLTSGGIVQ